MICVLIIYICGLILCEVGVEMLVIDSVMIGIIGGGQLEYMVIDCVWQMLVCGELIVWMNVLLGLEIG